MPLTVRGLLLGILSILDILEWVVSPAGWVIMSYLALYWIMVGLGLYDELSAIALSVALSIISGALLFDPVE